MSATKYKLKHPIKAGDRTIAELEFNELAITHLNLFYKAFSSLIEEGSIAGIDYDAVVDYLVMRTGEEKKALNKIKPEDAEGISAFLIEEKLGILGAEEDMGKSES